MTPRARAVWSHDVGFAPHKVTVYEEPSRKRVLYLRWRAVDGSGQRNWRRESLHRPLRDAQGRIQDDVQRWAVLQAEARMRHLRDGTPLDTSAPTVVAPLTILQGMARVIDPATGKYPVRSRNRYEVEEACKAAARLWGSDTTWNAIRKSHLIALWRGRIEELRARGKTGHRGAEVTLSRLLTVAAWLKEHELMDVTACVPPKHWKDELRKDWRTLSGATRDPKPSRPRHTIDELRRILTSAWDVDPRLGLLLAMGAELRLGQVVRCMRSDLELVRDDAGAIVSGWLSVPSSGKKRAPRVRLTTGQCASVALVLGEGGYLSAVAAAAKDFPLFPSGQMPGGRSGTPMADPARHATAAPVGRKTIQSWFAEAERLAKVESLRGRGPYGLRRTNVDEIKRLKISREGLKASGGWADTQVPDQIYAEEEQAAAAEEAAEKRAIVRGESAPPSPE